MYERTTKRANISKEDFVQNERIKLYNFFFNFDKKNIIEFDEDDVIDMIVAQIIAYVILRKRNMINRISEKVLK